MRVEQDLCPPRYLHLEWVASGGMGDLYRATDDTLGRPVAVKLLATRFAADEDVRKRFQREALTAARLSDLPNTVTIFDVGEWLGRPFIVMEYLGGGTLEDRLRSGAQPASRTVAWLGEAAMSLDAAHARGVVHRDVKPANLLLDDEGHVRVVDFGIARAAGLDPLTLTGTVLGSAGYLSPEQAQGRPATAASDGYGLAVVAFELLTGKRPYVRDSYTAEASAHVYDEVPSAEGRNKALPAGVDAVFTRGLAKDPKLRFSSCTALVSALAACTGETSRIATRPLALPLPTSTAEPPTQVVRRRRSRAPAALAALLIVAAGAADAVLGWRETTAHPAVRTITRTVTVAAAPHRSIARVPTPAVRPPAVGGDLFTRAYQLMLSGDYQGAVALLQQAFPGLEGSASPDSAYTFRDVGKQVAKPGHGHGHGWGRALHDRQD